MQVKGFKDLSGQEFIGEVVSEGLNMIDVKNPMSIVLTPKGILPVPYILSNEDTTITFSFSKLLLGPFDISNEMSESYRKIFSKIITPPEKLII